MIRSSEDFPPDTCFTVKEIYVIGGERTGTIEFWETSDMLPMPISEIIQKGIKPRSTVTFRKIHQR